MNIDGEMLPTPEIEIKNARLKSPVSMTMEDREILARIARVMRRKAKNPAPTWTNYQDAQRADDIIMLTRTMCPEAKPAVKDLAAFLKFSQ